LGEEVVRVKVVAVGDDGARVKLGEREAHVPPEDLPYTGGAPATSLEGRRLDALVLDDAPLTVSPRAAAERRCEELRRHGQRVAVRLICTGEHGTLADAGGLRGWFPPATPPRRSALGRRGGWITAVTPHLAFLSGTPQDEERGAALSATLTGTVTSVDRHGARVRLAGAAPEATLARLPRTEIAWHPVASADAELQRGDRVRVRVIELGLDGPVVSQRAAAPSPWPAIALELEPGTGVRLRVHTVLDRGAVARLVDHPHVTTLVGLDGLRAGDTLTATVGHVDVPRRHLVLRQVAAPLRAL
jgi:hypothetical protein